MVCTTANARQALAELSCIIHDGDLEDADRLGLQLVENCLREDLKPIEQARSYRRLMDARGWSTRQLAEELSIGQTSVVRALALLELPPTVQESVEQGALAATVAHEIGKLPDPEAQAEVAAAAVEQKMTRDEVAEFVQAKRARRPASAPRPDPVTIDLGEATVRVSWKKASAPDLVKVLRQALEAARSRDGEGRGEAAA